MNQTGSEAYFSHFHIREILDHFVCTYVRHEQDKRERANRSYLLKNLATDSTEGGEEQAELTEQENRDDENVMAIHPRLKVIVLLRKYLETYQVEEKLFLNQHPYVVFISSVLPTKGLSYEEWLLSPSSRAMVELARRMSEDPSVAAELYTPTTVGTEQVQTSLPLDSPEQQKMLDLFRIKKAGEIGGVLHTKEKSFTIILAREWPCAMGDAVAMRDVLGLPRLVVYFHHPEDDVPETGGFEESPGSIQSIQDISRRVHAVGVEAALSNPPRARAALLGYYKAREVLYNVEVSDEGSCMTPDMINIIMEKSRACRCELDSL